ncbi:MAG: DUF1385 domain-containing protein [Fimbriimonadaceae bacterium]|nr:DUF1385 domain-containing protein [Fimbriimonadaceae bacterium]
MRSPHHFAVAVRSPDGEIIVKAEPLAKTWIGRQKWLHWPFLRGSLALIDTMALGARAMRFAANVLSAHENGTAGPAGPKNSQKVQDIAIGGAMVGGIALGLFLFNYLPNLLAQPLERAGASGTLINFVTELIKIIFFLGYIGAIGRMPEIQEVFRYHGAEHKAINALEADRPLTIDEVRAQTRLHPRCGTSFAIVVLIVSLVIFTFVPRYPLGKPQGVLIDASLRFGIELLILPIISGIAFEIIRWAGKHRRERLVTSLLWPGLMSQYLTTREPDDKHLEVAIRSLQSVMALEQPESQPAPESADAETSSSADDDATTLS